MPWLEAQLNFITTTTIATINTTAAEGEAAGSESKSIRGAKGLHVIIFHQISGAFFNAAVSHISLISIDI
jgi:hypothetical protein